MPIRIYAFAKELGLDNKQLLDICEKVSIKGKGSALASLDDDEVARVKEHLSSGSATAVAEPDVIERTPIRPAPFRSASKKISEISAPQASAEAEAIVEETPADDQPAVEEAAEDVAAEPVAETPVVEEPVAEAPAADPPAETEETQDAVQEPAAEEQPVKPKVSSLLMRLRKNKEEQAKEAAAPPPVENDPPPKQKKPAPPKPTGPTPMTRRTGGLLRRTGAVRDLDQKAKRSDDPAKKDTLRRKTGTNVKIAAMPDVKQPTRGSGVSGEKVQKPDIALPQDAIAKARSGAAPLEQFTKSSKTKKKGKAGEESKVLGEMPSSTRRGKRGSDRDKDNSQREDGMGARPARSSRRPSPRRHNSYRRNNRRRSGKVANTAAPRKDKVVLQLPCTVREFSEAAGVPAIQALLTIQQLGDDSNKNINSQIEEELVDLLVDELGVEVEIREEQTLEDSVLAEFDESEADIEAMEPRAPIVTFLGHVDHGKTSLLDALIGIDVVSGEAGGITQHIRAYEIKKGDNKIAFVDTPGHEAFTEMRARGANVTDIAVLVVAADDGIMPQTEEAISHAKAAGVPIIVALNKIDLPGVTPDKAMQDLATHELLPSEWGGETEVVKTSAINNIGLDELLETILVTAELHEYKANFDRPAFGTCIEAEQQSDRGVVAKLMVQGGTLKVGDNVVCGSAFGRIKALHDTLRPKKKLKEAEPSTPVNVTGLDEAPGAGEKFYVVDDIAKAREIAESRKFRGTVQRVGGRTTKTSLQDFQELLESGDLGAKTGEVVTLNLIIRADVKGSIEAIQKELGKIAHPEVEIKILQALPGGVSVADVRLADASDAVIVGFNVVPDENARSLADELDVEVRRYDVIYKITDDLKATLEGKLKPEEQIVEQGMAMVLQTFVVSKTGTIAGCRVMRGTIQRECRLRVIRDSRVIGDYAIETLRREKDDSKEVQRGMECGIKLAGFNDVKEGDTLEAYKIEEVARTL